MIKKKLKKIYEFSGNSLNFLIFLFRIIYNGNFQNSLKESELNTKTAVVLANGPSLKEVIPRLFKADEFKGVDFFVLNYFANHDVFSVIKPKHYCLADPMFFYSTFREDEAKKLFSVLQEKVNWSMNIYIPSKHFQSFKTFSNINNKFINIVKVNTTEYTGFNTFRHFFYKKGLSMPLPGTVANLAIFVALNKGFKNIRLYGVEHSFLNSVQVNKQNQICNKFTHFYGEDSLKPIIKKDTGEIHSVSSYLYSVMIMFRSHEYLSKYAKYLNSTILNCTENSMIDSYEREK